MGVGDFTVAICDAATGAVLREVERTSLTESPHLGEKIRIDGGLFVVVDVMHEEQASAKRGKTIRKYTIPRIFVRPAGDSARDTTPPRGPQRGSRVLPFNHSQMRQSLDEETSAILPPSLIAVLVCAGYREQSTIFRQRDRVAAQLIHDGLGWFVENEAGTKEMWALSRDAKRNFNAVRLILEEREGAAIEWRQPAPLSKRAPPALQLITNGAG